MHNLIKTQKFTRVMNAVAAGTSDTQTGSRVDMQGWDGVTFVLMLGTVTTSGTAKLKVQQDTATGMGTAADLLGTGVDATDADSNKVLICEVYRPQERYVRPAVVRATANVVIDGCIAIQWMGRVSPVTQDATTVLSSEVHNSPIEGTA